MSSFVKAKSTKNNRDAKYGSQAGPINQRRSDEAITNYTSGSGRIYQALDPKSGAKLNEGNLKLLRRAAEKHNLHFIEQGGIYKSEEHAIKWINAIEDIFESEVIKNKGKPYKFGASTTIFIPNFLNWQYYHTKHTMSFRPPLYLKLKREPGGPPLKTMTESRMGKAKTLALSDSPPTPYNPEQKRAAIQRFLAKRKKRLSKKGTIGSGLASLKISTPKVETPIQKVHTPPAQAFLEQQKKRELEMEESRINDRNISWNYQNSVIQKEFKKKFKDIQAIKKEWSKDSTFKHIHKIIKRIDQHIHFTNIELDKSYTYSQSNFSGQWNKKGIATTKTVIDAHGNKKVARATEEDKTKQREQINSIKKKLGDLEKIKNRLGVLRDEVRLKIKSKGINVKTAKGFTDDLRKNYKELGIDYLLKPSDIQSDLTYNEDDTQEYSAIMKEIFNTIAKPCRVNDIDYDKEYVQGGLEELFGFELKDLDNGVDVEWGFEKDEKETIEKLANARGLVKLRHNKEELKKLFDRAPKLANGYVVRMIAFELQKTGRILNKTGPAPQKLPADWSVQTSRSTGKQYLYNKKTNERLWIVDPRNPCVGFKWEGKNKVLINVCGDNKGGDAKISVKGFNDEKLFSMDYKKNPNLWIDLILEGYGVDPQCPWLDTFYVNTKDKSGPGKGNLYIHRPWLHWFTYYVHFNKKQPGRQHLALLKGSTFKQLITFELGNFFIFDEYAQPDDMVNHVQSGLLLDETTSYMMYKDGKVVDTNVHISEPGALHYYLEYEKNNKKPLTKNNVESLDKGSSTDSSEYANSDDYMFQNFHVVKTHPQQWDIIETKYRQGGIDYLKKDIRRLKNQINTGVYGRPRIIQKRMYQGKEITESPSDSREADHYEAVTLLLEKMEELHIIMEGEDMEELPSSEESYKFSLPSDISSLSETTGGRRKRRTRRKKRRKKKTKRKRGGKKKTKRKRKRKKRKTRRR